MKRKGKALNSEEFTSETLSTVSQYGCTSYKAKTTAKFAPRVPFVLSQSI